MNKKLKAFLWLISAACIMACSNSKEKKTSVNEDTASEISDSSETAADIVEETENNEKTLDENEESSTDMGSTPVDENEEKQKPVEEEKEEVESEPTPIEHIKKADEIISSVKMSDVDAVDTKKLFRMHCAVCHGFKGNMMVNGAKDLTKSDVPLNQSVAQIYHGKGLMTPYKGILSDAEIVAMAKYTETLRK